MDLIDRRIIAHLVDDARISVTDLAAALPMSLSATSERLRRLYSSGVITKATIELAEREVGRPISAIVEVQLLHDADPAITERGLRDQLAVVDVLHLTGRFDFFVRVAARDIDDLNQLLTLLKDDLGAAETNTRLVLKVADGFPRPVATE